MRSRARPFYFKFHQRHSFTNTSRHARKVKTILAILPFKNVLRSLFDLLHSDDCDTLKSQLLTAEHGPRERLIGNYKNSLVQFEEHLFLDIKTGVSIKTESSPSFLSSAGAKRSFFCRMKKQKNEDDPNSVEFINVQVSGYIRTFPSSQCIPR